ncbi:Rne/Rng family ribonuclease [Lottiidibacillus patelloidae]|uniref:Rne/Rng family ribonuclease n=1 Tax=Lottiidibacillus patelloidae TaxID=2670334 RepID=UPI001302FB17|nr:Rne/Rng family ribonuclease [Lottiidibacillus patelloidae]
MQKKIIINARGSEKRAAILEEDLVVELLIDQPSNEAKAGDIFLGKVEKVIPGIQAAFIELGHEKNGYLGREDTLLATQQHPNEKLKGVTISQAITQGQSLLVQVAKEATGSKGPKLSEVIELSGKYIVYLPQGKYVAVSKRMKDEETREKWRSFGEQLCSNDEGLILRTACEEAAEDEIKKEFTYLRTSWNEIVQQAKGKKGPLKIHEEMSLFKQLLRSIPEDDISEIIIDDENERDRLIRFLHDSELPSKIKMHYEKEDIFSTYRIEQEIDKALKKIVWLKSGGFITFEKTEACTVIDVNTGKFTGKGNFQDTVLKTNIEAAKEIARQIRLRNSSGIILIDFINMKNMESQQQVRDVMVEQLKNDRTKTQVFHFTSVGILELTRKKIRQSLLETLTATCPTCAGIGRTETVPSAFYQMERELLQYRYQDDEALWLTVSSEMLHLMKYDFRVLYEELQKKLPFELFVTIREQSDQKTYEIKQLGTGKEIQTRIDKNHAL